MTEALNYKPFIQSLRAFAVLIVFFYHLQIDLFNLGYLGVDIFFVISGYVISQKLFKDIIRKKKNIIKEFYISRISRLIPSLIVILLFTLMAFIYLGPLETFVGAFRSFFFALLGFSNFYFLIRNGNYFDTVFENPFGHTWSLGVEMQFYFIFPLILLYLFKLFKNKNNIKIVIFFLSISLILMLINLFYEIKFNNLDFLFYNSLFRFWEFLLGVSVFFLSQKYKKKNNTIAILSILILFIILFYNVNFSFVQKNLISTILISIFIFYYNSKSILRNVFENKFLLYMGNISYSFYLWHLPVIYFLDLYFSNIIKITFSFPVSFFLSVLTFHYVEKKIKFFNFNLKYLVLIVFFISAVFMSLLYISSLKSSQSNIKNNIANIIYKINYPERTSNYYKRINLYNLSINGKKVYEYCKEKSKNFTENNLGLRKECLKNKDFNTLFFLEGHSLTAHYIPIFENMNNVYYNHLAHTYYNNYSSLNLINNLSIKYKEIIYVTNINDLEELDRLKKYTKRLENNIKILILGPTPFIYDHEPARCFFKKLNCTYSRDEDFTLRKLSFLISEINKFTQKDNVNYFNTYNSLCPENNSNCYSHDKDRDIVFFRDKMHFTKEGSKTLINDFNDFLVNK